MGEHNGATRHAIALSWSDLSVWCFACEQYIDSSALYELRQAVYTAKHGHAPSDEDPFAAMGMQITFQ